MNSLTELGKRAKAASKRLLLSSSQLKNDALMAICNALKTRADEIIEAEIGG